MSGQQDIRGGAYTDGYGEFVKKIFKPSSHIQRNLSDNPMYADVVYDDRSPIPSDLTAGLVLKMDELERKQEAQDATDIYSPLEFMYGLTEKKPTWDEMSTYSKYEVYQPKRSAEYYSTMYGNPQVEDSPAFQYKVSRTMNSPNVWAPQRAVDKDRYRITANSKRYIPPYNKSDKLMIDYKGYTSAPLSPHFYPISGSTLHNEDSRIHGSDFVMVNTRPNDPFLTKVDKLLEEVRNEPRYFP